MVGFIGWRPASSAKMPVELFGSPLSNLMFRWENFTWSFSDVYLDALEMKTDIASPPAETCNMSAPVLLRFDTVKPTLWCSCEMYVSLPGTGVISLSSRATSIVPRSS